MRLFYYAHVMPVKMSKWPWGTTIIFETRGFWSRITTLNSGFSFGSVFWQTTCPEQKLDSLSLHRLNQESKSMNVQRMQTLENICLQEINISCLPVYSELGRNYDQSCQHYFVNTTGLIHSKSQEADSYVHTPISRSDMFQPSFAMHSWNSVCAQDYLCII